MRASQEERKVNEFEKKVDAKVGESDPKTKIEAYLGPDTPKQEESQIPVACDKPKHFTPSLSSNDTMQPQAAINYSGPF